MSRALVIDTVTGVISRTLDGEPTLFALQLGAGESLWAIGDGDSGAKVDDAWVIVNGGGELELMAGAPAGVGAPAVSLEFVTEVAA